MELTEQEQQAYFRLSESEDVNPVWEELYAEFAANLPEGYEIDGDGRVTRLDPSLPERPVMLPKPTPTDTT